MIKKLVIGEELGGFNGDQVIIELQNELKAYSSKSKIKEKYFRLIDLQGNKNANINLI